MTAVVTIITDRSPASRGSSVVERWPLPLKSSLPTLSCDGISWCAGPAMPWDLCGIVDGVEAVVSDTSSGSVEDKTEGVLPKEELPG